jgi:hypothetical protein
MLILLAEVGLWLHQNFYKPFLTWGGEELLCQPKAIRRTSNSKLLRHSVGHETFHLFVSDNKDQTRHFIFV